MTPAQPSPRGGSTFGKYYAVLNWDFMTVLVDAVKDTEAGKAFISSFSRWNDAVHKKYPRPLTIFTRLYFGKGQPELPKDAALARLLESLGSFVAGSPAVKLSPIFNVDDNDIVLQKTRWYAGAGNALEQILRAQKINTSRLSLSAVGMSTIYRLFDLDYNIFVISDNVLEVPPDCHPEMAKAMLGTIAQNMNLNVILIDEALRMLEQS